MRGVEPAKYTNEMYERVVWMVAEVRAQHSQEEDRVRHFASVRNESGRPAALRPSRQDDAGQASGDQSENAE